MKETIRKILLLLLYLSILFLIIVFPLNNVEARSGCCSWHGGVCTYKCPDAVNVGYMCCDGTSLSAKCAPYYPGCPAKPAPKCPSHSTYSSSSGSCECDYGYKLIDGRCAEPEPVKEQLPVEEQSTKEPVLEESRVEELGSTSTETSIESQAPKEKLPASEKFTAEIPKGNIIGGSIWWWIIGIGAVGYLFYAFRKRKK